jgi:hypothetical protein
VWPVTPLRCHRIRDPGMGRLVQSPPAARADRQGAAGAVGDGLPSPAIWAGVSSLTQTNRSPEDPGRSSFTIPALDLDEGESIMVVSAGVGCCVLRFLYAPISLTPSRSMFLEPTQYRMKVPR